MAYLQKIQLVESERPTDLWLCTNNNHILKISEQHLPDLLPSGHWVQVIVVSEDEPTPNDWAITPNGLIQPCYEAFCKGINLVIAQSGTQLLVEKDGKNQAVPKIPESYLNHWIKAWNDKTPITECIVSFYNTYGISEVSVSENNEISILF